jgi:hypothetical protein
MTGDVISHRRARGKRGRMAWAVRRFGALAVAIAGLIVASFIAPLFTAAPTRSAPTIAPTPTRLQEPILPPAWPELADADIRLDLAGPPQPGPAQRRARRSGVRLDASAPHVGEDFEVLSAAELDAISQARH